MKLVNVKPHSQKAKLPPSTDWSPADWVWMGESRHRDAGPDPGGTEWGCEVTPRRMWVYAFSLGVLVGALVGALATAFIMAR